MGLLPFICSAQIEVPKREFRGAWIATVNGQFQGMSTEAMQKGLISRLDQLQKAGINAIIFQVRPESDAFYQSSIEPWSRFFTGVQGKAPSPFWDPMEFMVRECHKRGMEFHAWINPYRAKTKTTAALSPMHPYTAGLISTLPKFGQKGKLPTIPGIVPPAGQFPKGCVCAPRCKYATERCAAEKPGAFDAGGDHKVRCFRYSGSEEA